MFEEIIGNPAILAGLTIFGRNIYGWIVNSMRDGEIQDYEWKQLAQTFVVLAGAAVFAFMGLNAIIPGVSMEESVALVALIDVLKSYIAKK